MQFMNSSLEKLFKNLLDNDFRYLTKEFGSKNLELFKQKDVILMSTRIVLKDVVKKSCLTKNVFTGL